MTDLLTRLEQAEEGSRELDVAVWVETGGQVANQDRLTAEMLRISRFSHAPHYTTSLDAALTLVPEGWRTRDATNWGGGWDWILWKHPDGKRWTGRVMGAAPIPALALCLAALKARGAETEGK